MFILQLNFINSEKNSNKRPLQSKLFIEQFLFIFMVEEKKYLDRDMKKQEDLITFLKGQDVRHGSSECRRALY